MRLLFFAAAAAHAVLVAILFTASVDVMLLSGLAVIVYLVAAALPSTRRDMAG